MVANHPNSQLCIAPPREVSIVEMKAFESIDPVLNLDRIFQISSVELETFVSSWIFDRLNSWPTRRFDPSCQMEGIRIPISLVMTISQSIIKSKGRQV